MNVVEDTFDLQGTLLHEPEAVANVLERLLRLKTRIEVTPEHGDRPEGGHGHTRIIEIGLDRLMLERRCPTFCEHLVLGHPLPLTAPLDGGLVKFTPQTLGIAHLHDTPVLRTSFPGELLVLERRVSFRLRLLGRQLLNRSAVGQTHPEHPIQLLDLSLGGASASSSRIQGLQRGMPIRLRLGLTEGTLDMDAEVRWIRHRADVISFGVQFSEVDTAISARLGREINALQRGLLRRRAF